MTEKKTNQLSIDMPPVKFPSWYTPSGYRKQANANVAQGKHPMGRELLGAPYGTCGTCSHLIGGSYPKCERSRITNGPATDIVRKWVACVEWARE